MIDSFRNHDADDPAVRSGSQLYDPRSDYDVIEEKVGESRCSLLSYRYTLM
jgi:hypothetical protein